MMPLTLMGSLWICSHIGGTRIRANVSLFLPFGLLRVQSALAAEVGAAEPQAEMNHSSALVMTSNISGYDSFYRS